MRLSLIVPCFNEQDNIFPFARTVAEVFPDPSDYEIVFVNDGSKDKTLQNLKELHRQSRQNIWWSASPVTLARRAPFTPGCNTATANISV